MIVGELDETRELVRAVRAFLENYVRLHRHTDYEPQVAAAALRFNEPLLQIMRQVIDDSGIDYTDAMRKSNEFIKVMKNGK